MSTKRLIEPFRDQHDSDEQQEAERQHLDRGVTLDKAAHGACESHHEGNRDHDRGDHNGDLIDHADGGDDGVEGEDDVEQHDLHDDAGERRRDAS